LLIEKRVDLIRKLDERFQQDSKAPLSISIESPSGIELSR
jgi:hypothetical protein